MENIGLKHQQLVLVTAPFQGHLNPMLQLGQILYSKGFFITIAHFNLNPPDPSHHPDFHFLEIPYNFSDQISITGLLALVLELNMNCQPIFLSCLDELMNNQEKKISCIIYDELMYFSDAAANHLRLPCAIFRTASVAAFFSRISLFRLNDEGRIPSPDSILEDMVPGLNPFRFKDLPLTTTGSLEDYLRLLSETWKTRNSFANIFNTTSFLEEELLKKFRQEFQIQAFPFGPMHKFATSTSSSSVELEEDRTSCLEWLNKQARSSVLYVSMGSIASTDEDELNEMAWGLANSNQAFLWVIRPGSVEGSEWIESLPERFLEVIHGRGHLSKWAPQKEVLAHEAVGGFWSHCGWNSTLESISEGVPMICKPCFGDQKVNARYISHVWKVGFEIGNKANREDIEKAIRKLMVSSGGDELRQRAGDMKNMADVGVAEGGSSYNSLNSFVEKLQDLMIPP